MAEPLEEAKALALRVLAFHARSEAQLRDRLSRAGHAGCAGEVIAWLKGLGYLDDAAYARARARGLLSAGRAGPRLAERRLMAAGIPREDAKAAVAAALAELGSGAASRDELQLCAAAAGRRLRGRSVTDLDARERARLARHLLGRGFSGDAVARVLRMEVDAEP